MNRRVVIMTEIIAPYRIPVFNVLARQQQIDLHVIFLSETDASLRQWPVYGNEIRFPYEVLPSWRKRIGKYNLLLNASVVEALQRAAPDVIVCGGYNYVASWQALRWANRNKVQFLLWCESTVSDRRNQRRLVESLKQTFLRSCDAFVVPGESALRYLENRGVRRDAIFLAPNAVDIELFSALARKARAQGHCLRTRLALPDRYFLFVGRLVREKGVFDLLRAYEQLPEAARQEVGLVLAGDGPTRASLEAMARDIFPGTIHFAGFVQRDELAQYYGLSECLVLPTHTDTWGLVVNEAMACGLPVICTEVAGCTSDLVRENGRLVEPENVAQLSAAMQEIALDPGLRSRMSAESEKLIGHYSPDAWAQGMMQAASARQ